MIKYESQYPDELMHFGRSKPDGAPGPGSGRYPRGSGEDPRADKRDKKYASSSRGAAEKKIMKEAKAKAKAERKRVKFLRKQESILKKEEEKRKKLEKQIEARNKKFPKETTNASASKLTNEELLERIARLNLESTYKQSMQQARGKAPKNPGLLSQILKESGTAVLKGAASAAMIYGGKKIFQRLFKAEPSWDKSGTGRYGEFMKGFNVNLQFGNKGGGGNNGGEKKKK